ncbi:putative replication factor C large subunit [Danaus plexippus plexippus]|uniref:Replication factor C subunit 1 n=1 Tax=Danaus plexippus plexippus TaxID=278856 RepID=A0A212ENG2_DANPL|nr:putative replication factor C large subunit [Danaus plexippus plexippus]
MSRDIRSFFTVKKEKTKKDEDSDVIPESPNVQVTNKKKQSRKKRQIQEDSDEEIFSASNKKKNSPIKILKEVKAANLFGSAPIKRTEPIVKRIKKETELTIHSDEEFEQSLIQLDEKINQEIQATKEIPDETSMKKEDLVKDKKDDRSEKLIEDVTNNKKRKLNKSLNEGHGDNNKAEVNKKMKKDFSEFIENGEDLNKSEPAQESPESKQKKRKLDKSLNESVLSDEERYERKRQSAALYQRYLNRSGPKHLGTKEMPEGSPDCFKDCSFLLTGVLDSFERDDVIAAITKYGGVIKTGISKKVTHVIAGDDAGPAKLAKAREFGIKIMNEDEFLQFIRDSSNKKTPPKDVKKESGKKKDKSSEKKREKIKKSPQDKEINVNKAKVEESPRDIKKSEVKTNKVESKEESKEHPVKPVGREISHDGELKKSCSTEVSNSLMWVDKYKPKNLKQIIGQHGEASNVNKLLNWLKKWYANRKAKLPKPSPWAKNDDGGYYRAALLSGPPGVVCSCGDDKHFSLGGKTTTVSLVCKELGFDTVELNASDTRSKTLLKEQLGELLSTNTLQAYATGCAGKGAVSKKHVLVMDEVDGMAGNEDRGGLQELISLIKTTSVPVICMCNDRNSEKMRSLVNYCYDLKFARPRLEQIKSAMMSICFKEGIKISPEALSQLIVSSGQDIRQTVHLLSVCASGLTSDEAKAVRKDIKMGPWEAIRKVFSAEEHKTMSIIDKSDLFFCDYSIMPLFVQENFLNVTPHCPKNEILDRFSKAADSLSLGDLVEARIRGSQAWNLLPTQAMFSSVIPGHQLSGHVSGQMQFPSWLGKNSRANKMNRLCQEIHAHTRLSTSGSKSSIFLDYSTHLRDAITNPLIQDKTDGIEHSLNVLESYNLLREDLDSLVELSLWPGQRNPTVLIDSKVKAAMTRTYNKKASALPYAAASIKKVKATEDGELSHEEDDTSDVELDAMIKKKKEPTKTSTSKTKVKQEESASSSKAAAKKKSAPKQKKK